MSTLTLYYDSLLIKDKNFILDHWVSNTSRDPNAINTYLNTLTKVSISNFQYIKNRLNLQIKVDMNQSALNMGANSSDLNYVKIQNDGENPFYYFVMGKNWKSENTIELTLQMDTLNTFMYDSDYSVLPKTLIKRQHKDRFEKMSGTRSFQIQVIASVPFSFSFKDVRFYYSHISSASITANLTGTFSWTQHAMENGLTDYATISGSTSQSGLLTIIFRFEVDALRRIVDLKSEEISTPVYKTYDEQIYDSNEYEQATDWALYYKNSDNQENSPVDCFLVPNQDLVFKYNSVSGGFDENNIPNNKYLIFFQAYNDPIISFKINDSQYTPSTKYVNGDLQIYAIALFNDNGTIKVYQFTGVESPYTTGGSWELIYTSPSTLEVNNPPEYVRSRQEDSLPTYNTIFNNILYANGQNNYSTNMTGSTTSFLRGSNSIDKTLSTNIKIIHLPYCPTRMIVNNNVYESTIQWQFDVGEEKLKLAMDSIPFKNTIKSTIINPLWNLQQNLYRNISDLSTDLNRSLYDSKLYHSDFYRPKFVYDSYTKIFPLEKIDRYNSIYEYEFSFDFYTSRNITSKFMFKFNQFKYTYSSEDYDDIVCVHRNNEEVLYNSQYLDYIRTGYNYDIKTKERQETASGIGIGLNVAGLVASTIIGIATENPIAIGSAVASGIGLASQLVSYAKTTAQNEENIQRKLQESQMQAISVLNADDYDLLYAYSENKAKLCEYSISSDMREALDDLFFYCGYVINKQGKPAIHTRRSFNFVQASLSIEKNNNLSDEVEQDIISKFDAGVTFLHYSFNKWDFKQDKENIELSLLS